MKKLAIFAALALSFTMTGCTTLDKQYTYVVDQEHVTKVENLKRQQRNVAHVVWVNPPMVKQEIAQQPK